jgi:hypothetical protein
VRSGRLLRAATDLQQTERTVALFKRLVGAILIVCLMPQLTGCTLHATRLVPLTELYPEEVGTPPDGAERRFVGVTTADGNSRVFDSVPPPRVTQDTVFASVGGHDWVVAREAVSQVWVAGPVGRARQVNTSDVGSALAQPWPTRSSPVGVIMRAGDQVEFDRGAAVHFARDSVFASVHGAPFRIALNDVQRVAVVRAATPLLVAYGLVGIAVGVGLMAFLLRGGVGAVPRF